MKKNIVSAIKIKIVFIGLLALTLLPNSIYSSTIDLGSASSFGVLGGSAVTNVGNTIINGDLGIWPNTASSITGFPPGSYTGSLHAGNAVAQQAQNDSATAYNLLANMPFTQDLTGQNLGGLILTSGIYRFSSSAQLTGQLTLDAQNNPNSLFIFQIGSTLTTANGSSVIMMNAPDNFCNQY